MKQVLEDMIMKNNCEIAGQTLLAPTLDDMEPQNGINQSVAMAIAGTSAFGQKTSGSETYATFQQVKNGF
jgi:hypothetical protein